METTNLTKHPKRRVKRRREARRGHDLLTECANVFLFSLARNAGKEGDYEGALRCSADDREKAEGGAHE